MNFIRLRKNSLCVENISALTLAKKYKTPFYCYSLSQLKNNYHTFNNAFRIIKPTICFSVKSNSNLTLLRELKKIGSGADVVSLGELLKAIKAGMNPKKIVFSGVGKTEEEIREAVKKRALIKPANTTFFSSRDLRPKAVPPMVKAQPKVKISGFKTPSEICMNRNFKGRL